MRIAIAELKQETNTFVPFTTTVKTFEDQYLYRGDEILTAFGKARLEVPGALDAIKEAGAIAGAAAGHHGDGLGRGGAQELRHPDGRDRAAAEGGAAGGRRLPGAAWRHDPGG